MIDVKTIRKKLHIKCRWWTLDAVQKKLNSLSDTCGIFLSLCSQVQCVLILRGFLLLACFCYTNFKNMKQRKITPNKCHLPTSKRPPFIKRLSRRADQVLPGHVILFIMAKLILDQHSYPEKLSEYWHRFGMIQPTQQLQNSTSIP